MEIFVEKLNSYIYDEKHLHPERCHLFFEPKENKYYSFNADKFESKISLWTLLMIREIKHPIKIEEEFYYHKNKFKLTKLSEKELFYIELEYFKIEYELTDKYDLFFKNIKNSYMLLLKKEIVWTFIQTDINYTICYARLHHLISEKEEKELLNRKKIKNAKSIEINKDSDLSKIYSNYEDLFNIMNISKKMFKEYSKEFFKN